jgi:hypothetical protein
MKRLTLASLTWLILLNCSDHELKPNPSAQSTPVVGVWKLIQLQPGWMYPLKDYSNNNILFDFRSNGQLIITGAPNDVYPNGKYSYFFGEDYLLSSSDPKVLMVEFGTSKWTYDLTNGKMTLGQSYHDGPDFLFARE